MFEKFLQPSLCTLDVAERERFAFASIFGVNAVDVAAIAVARASKSSGSTGAPTSYNVGAKCLKPWIVQDVSPDGDPYGEEDLGTMVLLHDDQSVNGSSKWGIIAPCPTYTPPPTEPCDGGNSSTVYYENIVQCNPNAYYCGAGVMINDVPGNKVGQALRVLSIQLPEVPSTRLRL